MSAKREKIFCPETLSAEYPWKNVLLVAVAPKIIVHVGGQYGNATQWLSWSSSFENRQKFLAHPLTCVSNTRK